RKSGTSISGRRGSFWMVWRGSSELRRASKKRFNTEGTEEEHREHREALGRLQFGFFFVDFFVQLFDFFADLVAVFGVGIKVQVALVGFHGGLFFSFFFVEFAQKEERNRESRLCGGGVLEAIDGRVHVTLLHVELPNFNVFFGAQGIPLGLVG